MKNTQHKLVNEFALALMYLTAWKEKGDEVLCAWKGYNFTIPDALREEGSINFSYKAKSLYISGQGEEKAKQLIEKFKLDQDK